ncbi:MAG: M6 family metalloprotease domain-containing protein, partial [Candidatus Krumholzibacteria bacterium]|nr:M6 family metalloprotease domain-containing protein [Candidatus Krumholzibacteria bacterium]
MASLFLMLILILGVEAQAGIVSPRQGGKVPEQFQLLRQNLKGSFTLKHGWIERRSRQLKGEGSYRPVQYVSRCILSHPERALSGQMNVPVVLGLYGDISESPITPGMFQRELFTGPCATGTLSEYYEEVSFGLLSVTGTVFDWVSLSYPEYYYTGGIHQGLTPGESRTGELIKEVLDYLDPSVDFGAFDNDGPDGIANSGDDDGFVDVLVVIHPTRGAECRNTRNMWSHSWVYCGWPASDSLPYLTDDPAAGGGVVKIDDYIICPALSCESGMIEIGVFCHELGHTLGLPDLYDYNGFSSGIGNWGLMGSGNWNAPSSPAHLCAWSREQLGWVEPVEVDWQEQSLDLEPIAQSGEVVKLVLPTKRFRRCKQALAIGTYAMICAYTKSEADTREWPGSDGYGNEWRESIFHEFHSDGTSPVTLRY